MGGVSLKVFEMIINKQEDRYQENNFLYLVEFITGEGEDQKTITEYFSKERYIERFGSDPEDDYKKQEVNSLSL